MSLLHFGTSIWNLVGRLGTEQLKAPRSAERDGLAIATAEIYPLDLFNPGICSASGYYLERNLIAAADIPLSGCLENPILSSVNKHLS